MDSGSASLSFAIYSPEVLELIKEAGFAAAFTLYGQRVTHGTPADRIGRYAWYSKRPQDIEQAFNFSGPLNVLEPDSSVGRKEK